MNQIYVMTDRLSYASSDLIKYCANGDEIKVRSLLKTNVNIYSGDFRCNFVPLHFAIQSRNQELVSLLLDIYERDLEALNGTQFKRALVAMPEDQTEELLNTVEDDSADNVTPVLLKNSNHEKPKCVFLRNKLNNKNDSSLSLKKMLEAKNGFCDLNRRFNYCYNSEDDSFLHLAIYYDLKLIVQRLLSHPTVERSLVNFSNHSPLHYAIHIGNLSVINSLVVDCEDFPENSSYLYQAAVSGKQNSLAFVIDEMMKEGKSFKQILKIPFVFSEYDSTDKEDNLFHVMAKNGIFYNFFISQKYPIDEEDILLHNSEGDTVLHCMLLKSFQYKLNVKIKQISEIVKKFPKLLMVKNHEGHLPLHIAAFHDVFGQRLYQRILKLTVAESGNPDIFFSNTDAAVSTLLKAIEINKGLSEEYLENFKDLLISHGPQLLQKCIAVDKGHKSLKGILSASMPKINPNNFYDSTNGFLAMLKFNIHSAYSKPGQETYKRLQLLMSYHQIEDVNARDQTGTTLFMYIVSFCSDNEFIFSLINSGADCKATNDENCSCLHYAAANVKNKEIVEILIDNGADISACSSSFGLAIHIAILNYNDDATKLFMSLLEDCQLKAFYGDKSETLIQCFMSVSNETIVKLGFDLYKSRNIKINVNAANSDGDNMVMIALSHNHMYQLDFIISYFIEEIDFEARNNAGETLTHKFAMCQQMLKCKDVFERHNVLKDVVNKQMNLVSNENVTPMDHLLTIFSYSNDSSDEFIDFLLDIVTTDNIRKNLHKFIKVSTDAFHLLLKKLSVKLCDIKSFNKDNVLHIVCDTNDCVLIHKFLKLMTEDEVIALARENNNDNVLPFDLLNYENKDIFERCLGRV